MRQAVADEEGFISLIHTNMPKQENGSHIFSWMCHRNAIFDVAFSGLCALHALFCVVGMMRNAPASAASDGV